MISSVDAKALTLEQAGLAACGYCPFCEAFIHNWVPRFSTPDLTLDTLTGHTVACTRKDITL